MSEKQTILVVAIAMLAVMVGHIIAGAAR